MTRAISPAERLEAIINAVIDVEGRYNNDPDDRGGETMYGITVAVARSAGYLGPMRDLPIEVARTIYRRRYINAPGFDRVFEVDPEIGVELIDTGVNMGPARAAEFLQRWLNGFNFGGQYSQLFVDGRIGDVSIGALKAFLDWRGFVGRTAMLRGLNGVQAGRYLEITEARPAQRKFLFGWIMNRVDMEASAR